MCDDYDKTEVEEDFDSALADLCQQHYDQGYAVGFSEGKKSGYIEDIAKAKKFKNPNVFGEAVRDLAFVKENEDDLGCYSTFKLEEGFIKVNPQSAEGKRILAAFGICFEPDEKPDMWTNGPLTVAWFWDGDGILIVGDGEKMAINSDCKKDHGWEWVG